MQAVRLGVDPDPRGVLEYLQCLAQPFGGVDHAPDYCPILCRQTILALTDSTIPGSGHVNRAKLAGRVRLGGCGATLAYGTTNRSTTKIGGPELGQIWNRRDCLPGLDAIAVALHEALHPVQPTVL